MRRVLAVCCLAGSILLIAGWAVFARRQLGAQADGSFLLPTGQIIRPLGKLALLPMARPKGLAISPDGNRVAVLATDGMHFFDLNGKETGHVSFSGGPLGTAWGPSGQTVYATEENGTVAKLSLQNGKWSRQDLKIDVPGGRGNAQATGLAILGTKLYVGLGMRNSVVEYDLTTNAVTRIAHTDVAPYHLLLDGKQLAIFVACRGGQAAPKGDDDVADASGTLVHIDKGTDAVATGSIMRIDLSNFKVTRMLEGKQPAGLVIGPKSVLGTLSGSDSIVRLSDSARSSIEPSEDSYFGQLPTSMCLGPAGSRLYVTLGGTNAIAVCDATNLQVLGYVPTAWYPIKVAQVGNKLIVACAKGIGSRQPSAHPSTAITNDTIYYIHNNVGAVEFIDLSQLADLPKLTKVVATNNSWGTELAARSDAKPKPIPDRVGEPSVFKHVVYIIKENQTYDSLLGDMKEGNGRSDLCNYPEFVSPNHHQLARQFVLLDNTYVSGTNSADGHQWTDSAVANDYMEHNYNAYARSYPYDGGDPLAFSARGFLWNAALRSGKSVRVFGEFVDKPVVRNRETGKGGTAREIWEDYKNQTGKFDIHAETSQAALRKVLSPTYIGFPNTVSDQWRADQFLKEFNTWEKIGWMPNLVMMLLPCDHTGGFAPDFPTPWAAVADNDLALGRVVQAISNSRFWKDTLVLVIEDDGQAAVDHVDGHRVFAEVASPYTRRGVTVSQLYTTLSFLRTIELVLGIPSMTRFDRRANPLSECFTNFANMKPYAVRPNKVPLDEFTPKPDQLTGLSKQLAIQSSKQDWSQLDRADPNVVARSDWHFAHPDKPFPERYWHPDTDGDGDGD